MVVKFNIFESKGQYGQYWRVRVDEPYFSKSLEYLGIDDNRFRFMLESGFKHSEVFIIKNYSNTADPSGWDWNPVDSSMDIFEYMGFLNKLEDKDFEEMKLLRDAKKYNL